MSYISKILGNGKLYAILVATAILLARARRKSHRILDLMKADDFVFVIRTRGGAGGYFQLRDARLSLKLGRHRTPTYEQIWDDGHSAFRALTSSDESDVLRAFEDGRVSMRGEFRVALWFNECMKIARSRA